ncbi:hypothetical protein ACFQ9Q_12240 [Streptomyces virginiae]
MVKVLGSGYHETEEGRLDTTAGVFDLDFAAAIPGRRADEPQPAPAG